jgi:transcriptional regulator with XRE-family HTH domain
MTGAELKALREANDMSQEEFAKAIHIWRRTLGRAERNADRPLSNYLEHLVELAVLKGDIHHK